MTDIIFSLLLNCMLSYPWADPRLAGDYVLVDAMDEVLLEHQPMGDGSIRKICAADLDQHEGPSGPLQRT